MNNANPLVSILIPVYKRENVVKRAINSALKQTYRNIEIICVDNDSPDNTFNTLLEYQEKDNRIKVYKQEKNVGPVRNWMTCLEKSSGEYIKFLWSDDEISEDCIEKLIAPFIACNDIGLSYSKVDIYVEDEILKSKYQLGKTGKYKSIYFIKIAAGLILGKTVPVSPGCALLKREVVEKYLKVNYENDKGLDFSRYGAGNDSMLFYGACNDYKYIFYVDEALSNFYGEKDSFTITNKLEDYYEYVLEMFLKHNSKKFKFFTEKRMLLKTNFRNIEIKFIPFFIEYKIRLKFRRLRNFIIKKIKKTV